MVLTCVNIRSDVSMCLRNCQAYADTELEKVEAGQRAVPTVAEFLTELPEIVWP